MNDENLRKWLDDLRTTQAKQCAGQLALPVSTAWGEEAPGYCCLGRGEIVRGAREEGSLFDGKAATREFVEWLGLDLSKHDRDYHHDSSCYCEFDLQLGSEDGYVSAAGMNDEGSSFFEIAVYIEEHGIRGVTSV